MKMVVNVLEKKQSLEKCQINTISSVNDADTETSSEEGMVHKSCNTKISHKSSLYVAIIVLLIMALLVCIVLMAVGFPSYRKCQQKLKQCKEDDDMLIDRAFEDGMDDSSEMPGGSDLMKPLQSIANSMSDLCMPEGSDEPDENCLRGRITICLRIIRRDMRRNSSRRRQSFP